MMRPVGAKGGTVSQAELDRPAAAASAQVEAVWMPWLIVALGAWLLASPQPLALFDPLASHLIRNISLERALPPTAMRNALTGGNDLLCGLLLLLLGTLSLRARWAWAQWLSAAVGVWLLFAPLLFWTPSAAAYTNDTVVGALAIVFSVVVPPAPGIDRAALLDDSNVPPGWNYSPSSRLQRLPMLLLSFIGFLVARTLAAYQLGHSDYVWEPFFAGAPGENGSETVITSWLSRAWPIPDAGLGATCYLLETLLAAMGDDRRWRTKPWLVAAFFLLVIPVGGVSILFIIVQPILLHTYCTLCLIMAFTMLLMIPLTVDEVVAAWQYLAASRRAGRPLLRTLLLGGPAPEASEQPQTGFDAPLLQQGCAALRGITVPWTLLACCLVGVVLMLSRLWIGVADTRLANGNHLLGALALSVSIVAMAELLRPLRWLNALFGLGLLAVPWILAAGSARERWFDVAAGILLIALSVPRGRRSAAHYGSADRWVR
jgi:hypothetical protein